MAGLDQKGRNDFDRELRNALNNENMEFFEQLAGSLCVQLPEREQIVRVNARYLERLVGGISICVKDSGANNGGCTEPHVSHILASRLSSRPMAWSKATLKKLAPILAAGKVDFVSKSKLEAMKSLPKALQKVAVSANKAFCRGSIGLPAPDSIGKLPVSGKITGTQKILKLFV